jgi:hypothetical protein
MGSEKDTYKIEKFNGTNFSFWKMQMEDYLYQKDLYLPIVEKPKDMSDEEWVVERIHHGCKEGSIIFNAQCERLWK